VLWNTKEDPWYAISGLCYLIFRYTSYILGNLPLQFSVSSCVLQITDSRASLIVSRAIVA
jgi:hypothetical protein